MVIATPLLAGCATPSWVCFDPPGPSRVTIVATPDANANSAVAVDLVLISDKVAAQQLAGLSAADFFKNRTQYERDFGTGMREVYWELAPGQIVRNAPTHPVCNRAATLLFARYSSPGAHRQALAGHDSIVITLGPQDFSVSP
jgi:type VI secretion system protein